MTNFLRFAFVWLLALSAGSHAAFGQYTSPDIRGTSRIAAKVQDAEGRPVQGARVLAFHLSSARLFKSEAAPKNGECAIAELPYGYFDLAVETPQGLFIADRVINVGPEGTAAVILTIAPFDPSTQAQARRHPGSDLDPTGLAALRSKAKGRDFWRSPKGVAIVSGLSAAALLAIASGSSDEPVPTPF